MRSNFLTSEYVSCGHPDKVADMISDSVVEYILKNDPKARVACETMVSRGKVNLAGEITTVIEDVPYEDIAREAIKTIGYVYPGDGNCYDEVTVETNIHAQSPDIALGTNDQVQGAGDQGFVVGFADPTTITGLPVEIHLARAIALALHEAQYTVDWMRPDIKTQVTTAFDSEAGKRVVDTVVVAQSHSDEVTQEFIKEEVSKIVYKVLEENGWGVGDVKLHINSTGSFAVYGASEDVGLTGRKIVVDQYGCACPVGGGAFSGKDPSKVDRSAAYAARMVAKHFAIALNKQVEVQIAYTIGVAEPVSVNVIVDGELRQELCDVVREIFDLTPAGIAQTLGLRDTEREWKYSDCVLFGHFGNNANPWEKVSDEVVEKIKAFC